MEILVSKLQTPKRYNILHRERLIRVFENIVQYSLVTITAGAGYGKTTLVMDALSHQNIISVWYRLDEQDTDFQVFISYLYSAVQHHFPGTNEIGTNEIGTNPIAKTGPIPKTSLKKPTDTLLEWLAFAERKITKPAVLVLDDYHLVQDNDQINKAIEFILERLAEHIHMIIIGRKNLKLKVSTLRASGKLIELNENDLSFTTGEVKIFFTQTLGLTQSQIKDIHSSTGGWAASLVLLRYAFKKKSPDAIAGNLELFRKTPDTIFSYLKETIFDTQPDPIKTFMMKAALLPEIDTQQCSKLFDIDDTDIILKQMIDDHLMIFPVDESGSVFYLHHLFRDFLITQLNERFSKSEIFKLHCNIAHKTEENDIFSALHHFIEGHDWDQAIRLIDTHEMRFLLEGKINFLERCLTKIPKKIIEENPQLLLAQAKLFTYFGNPRQARILLTRAHKLFKKQESKENMIKCLVELGFQYYFTGYVKEAKLLMEQVLDDVEKPSLTYIIAMTYLTFLSSVLGEFETAATYYKEVWDVIETLPDFKRKASSVLINTSYSYTRYINGEFKQAQKLNEKLLKSSIELNVDPCLPLIYYQLSATSYCLGHFDAGIEYAQKGIEICEKISLLDSRKGWIYLAWAQNYLGLGKHDQAIEYIDLSIELYEEPGNRWGMANAWECLHQVYLAQGKFELAKQILHKAIDIIDGYGLPLTEGILENSQASLLMIEKKHSKALETLESARTKLTGAGYHMFKNHLFTSRSHLESGNPVNAVHHLTMALSLSEVNRYDRCIKKEKNWLIPFVKQSSSKSAGLSKQHLLYLENIFKTDFIKETPQLNISLLGQFKLTVKDRELPLSEWKSTKALMILKYLAANRPQGFIPREVLIEMLWPNQDLKKTSSRFNMAMSALRKTLEPNLSPKAPSSYIERKKELYRLSNKPKISVDIEQFSEFSALGQKEADKSDKALELYLLAYSLYRDEFLKEDLYEDWCIRQREYFIAQYLKVLKIIVDLYEDKDDFVNAIVFAKKILAVEAYDESTFKRLMIFYAKTGNMSNVTKIFHRYKKISEDMDCPIRKDIKELLVDLVKI
ncbi:MAG: BTAD domain-containing putative transcriptional regulator [Desulfobacula sp.]|nr:BTAD domain-containing putative transcriptional regulator [Desulfobacula sp.]